jgi:nicotinic acid mononucleotide adenylyltransferase
LDSDALVLSSSEIREKTARGEDISSLVPSAVSEFIKEKGLYGNN